MSIYERIEQLIDDGKLWPVEPLFAADGVARHMLVSEEIWALLDSPPKKWAVRCAKMRADLERFVVGDEINLCPTPFKAQEAYLGLLSPPNSGIWDVRLVAPRPSVRLIGCFAKMDTFVALIPASRSKKIDLLFRGPLGDKHSAQWENVIDECDTTWWTLFQHNDRVRSTDVQHDLISDKFRIV